MKCPQCEKDDQVVKNGMVYTPNEKQRYLCKRCEITFTEKPGDEAIGE